MSPRAKCFSCGTRCPACNKRNKDGLMPPNLATHAGFVRLCSAVTTRLKKFGKWLFSDQHRDSTVLAHNMKGYDGVFLLEYLLNHGFTAAKDHL